MLDTDAVTAAWDADLETHLQWDGAIPSGSTETSMPGNLLVDQRADLSAVIDFGGLGVGDPACDFVAGVDAVLQRKRKPGRVPRGALRSTTRAGRVGRGWALSTGA